MKLRSIKKLLDRIDLEIYPLWLENTLDKDNVNVEFSIDWNKGTTSLSPSNFINRPFTWRDTPQDYDYWCEIETKTVNYMKKIIPWIYNRLPIHTPEYFTKFWYFRKEYGRTCIAYLIDGQIMVYAGCFVGTIDQFEAAANREYGNNTSENYAKHILWLRELELKNK